jgi:uncharacterized protein
VAGDLTAFLAAEPVVDIHEHHMPEILNARDVGLLDLLAQSYAGWTHARPYPLPSETASGYRPPIVPEEPCWDDVAAYVERSGSNAFVRSLVSALTDLYSLGKGGITRENWASLDAKVRRCHADPGWPETVITRAGIEEIITDPFSDPLLDARAALGPRYRSVARVNALALGWHPDSRDHNGNSGHAFAQALGVQLDTFEDYVAFLELFVDTLAERKQVALKSALAYDRDLSFDQPDKALARRAWGQRNPSPQERKAFGDFVVDHLCGLAGERDVPFQMHLGTALIRGSHPMNASGLIERNPGTRFLLMHLAYPWSRDLLGLAFVYRNIWLDLTWSFLLSPSHFKLALHEAIDILPDESRMMLGGDSWHAEESYGAIMLARRLIAEVLEKRVAGGYLDEEGAERLARRILSENARAFFRLSSADTSSNRLARAARPAVAP